MKVKKSIVARKAWVSFSIALVLVLVTGSKVLGIADSVWLGRYPAEIWSFNAKCQNHMKQLALTLITFSNESQGDVYPQLSSEPGKLMFDASEVYPYNLSNPEILVCPGVGDPLPENLFDDKYYVYTGYLLTSDQDVVSFAQAYTDVIDNAGDFSGNLVGDVSYPVWGEGGTEILRLRKGVERFFITDINQPLAGWQLRSEIPVLWEWPDNHQQGWGGNVLYLDGHVEWVDYPGEFPMTETCITTLAELANYVPPTSRAQYESLYTNEEDPRGTKREFLRTCVNNLRELGLINLISSNGSLGGVLPLLSSESGRLMMESTELFPSYMTNETLLLCDGPAEQISESSFDDQHYVYFSHVMLTDADVQSFANVYPGIISGGGDFSGDLVAPASYGDGDTLNRMRDIWGYNNFFTVNSDPNPTYYAEDQIPLILEWPDNHEGLSGGNVLFKDGHVEWMEYPGEFPMTEATITTLANLADREPVTEWRGVSPEKVFGVDPFGYIRSCSNNFSRLGYLNIWYSYETTGYFFPPLSNESGRLMYDETSFQGNEFLTFEFLSNSNIFGCPGTTTDAADIYFDDQHYVYLGYILTGDDDVLSFVDAYTAQIGTGGDFTEDLVATSSYGDSIKRLKERATIFVDGVDPFEQVVGGHEIPVMIEWPDHHEGFSGGNVLFMDGHVEWMEYPGKFPMTETTINALGSIAGFTPTTEWGSEDYTVTNDSQLRALCAYSLAYPLNLSFVTYANHSNEQSFPSVSSQDGRLMMDDARYLQFNLFELERLNCPGSDVAYQAPSMDDHSYAYLGYAVRNDEDLQLYAEGYQSQIAIGGDFDEDFDVNGVTIPTLRYGLYRTYNNETHETSYDLSYAEHLLPVLIEWPDNHFNLRGGNVLYMDGHVEWIDYPGKFPMTVAAMNILTGLAGRSEILPLLTSGLQELADDVFHRYWTLDTNNDLYISFSESGLSEFEFNQFDVDGDGLLSIPDLLQVSLGPLGIHNPVYVDFRYPATEHGTEEQPFRHLLKGVNFVNPGGSVLIKPGRTDETMILSGPMRLERDGTTGTVRIGE